MADIEKACDQDGQKTDRNATRSSRIEQRQFKSKFKVEENELPAPPPDPWASPWRLQNSPNQVELTQNRNMEEDEDIIAYLTDIGQLPYESRTLDCPSRNSAMAVSNFYTEDAFEQLDRLYVFAEQVLELRNRNSKFFKKVRNLERLKTLRNANNKLESAFVRDKEATINFGEEDTGFAESLLDAMLANCRDFPYQKRNIRSSATRQVREKFDDKQTSLDEISGSAPKVSKWTRVKAAFKWERAYTNDTEMTDSLTMAPSTPTTTSVPLLSPTTKYLRIPDEIRESNSSSSINESYNLGLPCGRTSSASSSNEGSYDCSQKSISNHSDEQSLKRKTNKKTECTNESLNDDVITNTSQINETGITNEVGQGKPVIRITSEKNHTVQSSSKNEEKDTKLTKRPTPTLTITIPQQEDDIRYTSSSEANSPLYSANVSGGSSPQPRKTYRNSSINKNFKRQQSYDGETVILSPKMQRQDSKWNKVRRAFLTNSALSVPSNLINIVPRQTLLRDGLESPTSCNFDDSADNTERTIPVNAQIDARQEYRILREKLGSEFQQKLIEWERLKNLSPRPGAKENSFNLPSTRENILSEERLAPEFKKKLQDWKHARKIRRGSTPFDQQRIGRRRLTDWQLWRSHSKTEYRSKETVGSRASSENGEIVSDGKSQLYEDFARKMESWRRVNGGNETNSQRFGNASGIDESEFFALEKSLSLFNNNVNKGPQESDAQRLDECFDGHIKSHVSGAQHVNDTNEILVRTSVGSYRFEGISREFTRKLYDWERYRGISPQSSTFRLLGPAYAKDATIEVQTDDSSAIKDKSDEPVLFRICSLKRSKSVGDLIGNAVQNEGFLRRWNSLQSMNHSTNRLKNADSLNTLLSPIDHQRTDDATEYTMDDSEPEAMIVDIEDVIEETASPLERVQPHQTPVYSVAASETTSIAVPLGTVTSSHEPSPVCFVEIDENIDCKHWQSKRWNHRRSISSEDSLSLEQFETSKIRSRRKVSNCGNTDFKHSSLTSLNIKIDLDRELDKDSARSNSSIASMDSERSVKESKQNYDNFRENSFVAPLDTKYAIEMCRKEYSDAYRYNQELSNEKEREEGSDDKEVENGRSSNDGNDIGESTIKTNDEYEEVGEPRYCSLTNVQSLSNCNEETIKTEESLFHKSDEAKTDKENENSDKSEGDYCVIRDELYDRNLNRYESPKSRIEYSLRSREAGTSAQLINTNNWQSNSANVPTNSSNRELRHEPTIRTTAYTIVPSRTERCLERFIVNEETLNKIIVPTASTGGKANNAKQSVESKNESSTENASFNQETSSKKQSSPTRNVFIRTKRIIFSPFRKSEEHSAAKKENNSFENDHVFSLRNKSKSRSGSPKVNRQDALLRMSLSLPWPLRPSSKDREIKETRIEQRDDRTEKRSFERCKSVETSRKSSNNGVFQTRDKNSPIELIGKSIELKNQRGSLRSDEQASFKSSLPTLKTEEKTSSSRFDPQSSDLIHKLAILSNAVAKREGRTISEDSSLESHSLRVRRAKEDFLSRRGGPLCHSVIESSSSITKNSLKTYCHYYEHVEENQGKIETCHAFDSGETSNNCEAKESKEEKKTEEFLNDLSNRPDRVKSASAGMINLDPDAFMHLTEANRGCESLPRSISKQQQPFGSLAKIVNKFKFARLMRSKDVEEQNMSTISKLCRQSLLIDVRNDLERKFETSDRENGSKVNTTEKTKRNK